jgi:peroxiredoxin
VIEEGKPAPNFELTSDSGETVSQGVDFRASR